MRHTTDGTAVAIREAPCMHIEPIIPDFEYATIRRTGGILGVDETLHIDRRDTVAVKSRLTGDRVFEVDAFTSQELMHALARLVEVNPGPSTHRGFDMFHYDIELNIGGRVHTFHSVDVGADDALHGVMIAAARLAELDPANTVHPMELHVTPAVTA